MQKKTVISSVIAIVALLAVFVFLYQKSASPVAVSYPEGTTMPAPINIVPAHRPGSNLPAPNTGRNPGG